MKVTTILYSAIFLALVLADPSMGQMTIEYEGIPYSPSELLRRAQKVHDAQNSPLPQRGEYETITEYEKRVSRTRRIRDYESEYSELDCHYQAPVILRYDVDNERFLFLDLFPCNSDQSIFEVQRLVGGILQEVELADKEYKKLNLGSSSSQEFVHWLFTYEPFIKPGRFERLYAKVELNPSTGYLTPVDGFKGWRPVCRTYFDFNVSAQSTVFQHVEGRLSRISLYFHKDWDRRSIRRAEATPIWQWRTSRLAEHGKTISLIAKCEVLQARKLKAIETDLRWVYKGKSVLRPPVHEMSPKKDTVSNWRFVLNVESIHLVNIVSNDTMLAITPSAKPSVNEAGIPAKATKYRTTYDTFTPCTQDAMNESWLGIIVDSRSRDRQGIRVAGTVPGSPAEAIGLRPGDWVVQIESSPVPNYSYAISAIDRLCPGELTTIIYHRMHNGTLKIGDANRIGNSGWGRRTALITVGKRGNNSKETL